MDLLIRTGGKNQWRWVLWNVASRHRWMNKKKKEKKKRTDETQRQRFRNIWRDKRCVGLFAKLLNLHCTSLTQISVWKSEPATKITVLQGYRRTPPSLVKVPASTISKHLTRPKFDHFLSAFFVFLHSIKNIPSLSHNSVFCLDSCGWIEKKESLKDSRVRIASMIP